MKAEIIEKIEKAGLKLFRKHGYAKVTMRNIAEDLGISVGNLTYHFKKKEDLIESVLQKQVASFQPPKTPTTIKELHEFFLRSVEEQKSDDYFFKYYNELEIISPKAYALQVNAIKQRKKKIQESFAILQKKGLLKPEEITGHRDALIDVLNIIKIYWSPSQEALPKAFDSPMDCIWSILYEQLTETGKEEFHEDI